MTRRAGWWRTLVLGAAAVSLGAALACTRQAPSPDVAEAKAALIEQAGRWDEAIVRKDTAAIARNMSEDFRHIGKTGEVSDGATFLREILSPDLVIDPYEVEALDVRVYGECALLCGETRMTGSYRGERFTSHYRYVDTYVRSGGRWRVCNVQISGMPEAAPGGAAEGAG